MIPIRGRVGAAAVGIIAVAMICAGVGTRQAHAVAPTSYSMTASANTLSVELDVANAPLLAPQVFDGSPSAAQAHLDSFGGSNAYAGAPFLGQTIEGVGGLVSGLGYGVLPPLPATLPGYVATSSPSDPTASASQGPYTLTAQSGVSSSSAEAGIAADGQPTLISSSATASTTVNSDGALASNAQSITQPFALGSLVQIGTVQASAAMSVDGNGNQSQTSSFDLGSITIAGIKIGLTQNGLQLLGSSIAVPSLATLNALLGSEGISLELLPASKTSTSITSGGLQIGLKKSVPVEGASGIIITLGQATAQLQSGSVTSTTVSEPTVSTGNSGTATSGNTGTGVAVSGVPSTGSSELGGSQPSPTDSIGSGSSPAPADAPIAETTMRATGHLGPDGLTFYLILFAAALSLIAASRATGALGVRRSGLGVNGSK